MSCGYNTWVTFDCHNGYLHDMDYDYIDHEDVTYACPKCNTLQYLENAKENAESTVSGGYNGSYYTGVDIWEVAIKTLNDLNIDVNDLLINNIKSVNALYEDDSDKSNFLVKEYKYMSNEVKDFIESESFQISLIEDFEKFVNLATGNLDKLEFKVIQFVIQFLERKENQTDWNYYRLLRILPLILDDHPDWVIKIPRYFIDEQFIQKCYILCPETTKYMTKFDVKVYLSAKFKYKLLRHLIKTFKFFKASSLPDDNKHGA